MPTNRCCTISLVIALLVLLVPGPLAEAADAPVGPSEPAATAAYTLGPHDEIQIHVVGSDETPNAPVRIGADGYVNIPLAGRFKAAGLTVEEIEAKVAARPPGTLSPQAASVGERPTFAESAGHGVGRGAIAGRASGGGAEDTARDHLARGRVSRR